MTTVAEKQVNRLAIAETTRSGKPYIQFDFTGYFDHPAALQGAEQWKALMKGDTKRDLIFNCAEMHGFDSTSRQLWQAVMKEHKSRIGNIWVISNNSFILAAAKTMGLLAGFSIKVAKSLDQIKP